MRIKTYIMTYPDEVDVLLNPILSVREFSDEIWVVDGGPEGHLCYEPRENLQPLKQFCEEWKVRYLKMTWPGRPGTQRNRIMSAIGGGRKDWIVQIDSDECFDPMWSQQMRRFLEEADTDGYTNVCPYMYALYPNEQHYLTHEAFSGLMHHSRMYKTGTIRWTESWHEHQDYQGPRLEAPEVSKFHLRVLFEKRLRRQRGHGVEGWDVSTDVEELPYGVQTPEILWPDEELMR